MSSGAAPARKMVSSAGPDSSQRFRMSRLMTSFATSATRSISVSQESRCAVRQADAVPLADAEPLGSGSILLSQHKRRPVVEPGVDVRVGSEKHDAFNSGGELRGLAFCRQKGVLRADRD